MISDSQRDTLPKKEKVGRISKAHFKMKDKETQLDQKNAETKHAYKKIWQKLTRWKKYKIISIKPRSKIFVCVISLVLNEGYMWTKETSGSVYSLQETFFTNCCVAWTGEF